MEYVINTTLTKNVSFFENQTINKTGNIKTEFTDFSYEEVIKLVINLYCIPILCVFGIIGNILSIIVLGKDDVMRKTTRFLLQNVAVADIGFLVSCIFVLSLNNVETLPNLDALTTPYILPVASICQMATVYAVVAVTVDRYIAICRPLQSIQLSTVRNGRWAVGVMWAMAVIFNIPRFFELEFISYSCEDSDDVQKMCYYLKRTGFSSTKVYRIVYETILYIVVRVCTPLLILVICNAKLLKAIRSSREMQDETHRHQKNTTVMLISVVIVFFICTIPGTMFQLYNTIVYESDDWGIAIIISYFGNLFLIVNSAFNFVLYLSRGERFRYILWNMCKCHRVRVTNEI